MSKPDNFSSQELIECARSVLLALDDYVLGQRSAAEQILVAFMAGGHVLLQGVPGVGKTLMARCFSGCLGVELKRVQFTPDLMPTDVTGTNVFDPSGGSFRLLKGPIFTEIFMADEINRTPPKTQSALLESMQEGQVSIDGESYPLSELFFVMATQNPVEFEGTYPLPEAQADRFLLTVTMGLPKQEDEIALLKMGLRLPLHRWRDEQLPQRMLTDEQVLMLRRGSRYSHVSDELLTYLQALAVRVREDSVVELGPSPRACLALLEAARAHCWLEERDFVTPDDIKALVVPCWGHRVLLSPEAEIEGRTSNNVLGRAVDSVEVPKSAEAPDPGRARSEEPSE